MFEFILGIGLFYYVWIAALIIAAITVTSLAENDSPGLATIVALVVAAAFEVFSPLKPLTFVITNPVTTIVCLALYLAAGSAYGVAKWWRYVTCLREKYDEYVADRLVRMGKTLAELSEDELRTVYDAARNQVAGYGKTLPPQINSHKAQFTGWVAFWPFSLGWTLLNDPFRRAIRAIFKALSGTLQSISDAAFSDLPDHARKS